MNISILTNLILQQYFVNYRCLIILTELPRYFEYGGKHQIINLSLHFSENQSLLIDEFITTNYHGCQGFVIDSLKPVEVFEHLEEKIRHSWIRFHFRRYLFIIRNEDDKNAELHFETDALTHVADVLLLFPKNNEVFQLWTHNYVGLKDMNTLKLVDEWYPNTSSFKFGNDLYPDKLASQEGRKFVLTCINYPPYCSCDPDLSYDEYFGSELKAAVEYGLARNMSIEFRFNDNDNDLWGDLYANWTGTGLMGNILRDEADIGFAAFNTWGFVAGYLDISGPYIRAGVPCLVPKPEPISGWLIPILCYPSSLWIAALSNFVFNVVLFSLINMYYEIPQQINYSKLKVSYDTFVKTFWTVLKISLSQGISKTEKQDYTIVRSVLLVLFLMYSILDSTYFSGLASIMTIPRFEPPINTVAELAYHDVNVIALSEVWTFTFAKSDDEVYKQIMAHFKSATYEQRELSKQKNNAFMIERLPYDGYCINEYIQKDVIENYHLMVEDVFWDYTRFFLRKSSILTPSLDIFIMRLIEVGITSPWQEQAVYKFMDSSLQRMITFMDKQRNGPHDIVKLKFFHVEGAFGLLIIGCSLSFITFVIEKILYHYYDSHKHSGPRKFAYE